MSQPELNWVESAQKGDRDAFNRLIETYQRQAVAVAFRMLSNRDDALEAAQNAFVRAYQALDQLQDPQRFGPWLMRIVTNQSLNYRRSRSKHRHLSLSQTANDDEQENRLEQTIAGNEPSSLEQLTAGELEIQMKEAIDELPENLRTSLLLFSVEKLPQKEIAKIQDCSLQTVKWNVFEARRRLKNRLEKWL